MPSQLTLDTWRPGPVARLGSWLGDWAVVAAWLGVLTLAGLVLRPLLPDSAWPATGTQLLRTDLLFTVITVLPYVVYLSVTESSRRRATLGKRWSGLEVADADGGRARAGQIWVRNIVKALPWQLAHLAVSRAVLDVQLGAAIAFNIASLLILAACAVPALAGARGLHDRIAGTRVQRADAPSGHPQSPER